MTRDVIQSVTYRTSGGFRRSSSAGLNSGFFEFPPRFPGGVVGRGGFSFFYTHQPDCRNDGPARNPPAKRSRQRAF
jgi:hypothetical protein